jgi:hypothetical protein
MPRRTAYPWTAALLASLTAACGGTEAVTNSGNPTATPDATDALEVDAGDASTGDDADGTLDGTVPIGDATPDAAIDGGSATCVSPQSSCAGSCTDVQADRNNCGACGIQCGAGTVCAGGRCSATCGALATCTVEAGTYCANPNTDNANCGTCGSACPTGTVCRGGECGLTCGALATCAPDGGAPYCANNATDNANCGTCGHACGPGTVCSDGACGLTCGALTMCSPDGGTPYCANTQTDNTSCGTCGHACGAGTVCSGGACQTTCGGKLVDCKGACVDGQDDPDHCGATADCSGAHAGVQCAAGKSCVKGACVCDGKTTCGGACVDTANDTGNCGGCGNVCQGLCVNGGCVTSCANLKALSPRSPSGTYLIDPDGIGPAPAYSAYCDMTHNGGGWTLALKVDGGNASSSFTYASALWTNGATLNAGSVDLARTEAKFPSFSQIVASAVLLEMVDTSSSATPLPVNTQVVTLSSPSTLLGLVNGPYTPTSLGRGAWSALADNATLQLNCNYEGFNAFFSGSYARARIGLLGNQENDCNSPDSAIGFGVEVGPGNPCYATDPSYAAGVAGGGTCGPGGANRTLFGYVFVR